MTINHQSPNVSNQMPRDLSTWSSYFVAYYIICFQFGLMQLPLSDSQELYLDLPGPKDRPDDSDDDDDDDDEDVEQGKDGTAPVLGEPKKSNPPQDVLENDLHISEDSEETKGVERRVEMGIYQQQCVFGLKEKIEAMKAKIAEAKSRGEGAPSIPPPAIKKDTPTSRAEEIKIRMEELHKSLEKMKFPVLNKTRTVYFCKKCTPFTLDLGL